MNTKESEQTLQQFNAEEMQITLRVDGKCDKYDYLAAVACGAIGGIIDIFLVGTPNDSILGKWTDQQVDNAVIKFAKMTGWEAREGQKTNVASAIGYLEKKFRVNYDQRYGADVGNVFNMATKNHHLMSLSHSPDIIGLFFSILNQFTSSSSFVVKGQLITVKSETFELFGTNFISKLFCGVANWFGHIMSDIAGSSGSRGNAGRGTGVAVPFYELFQFCKFGKLSVGNDKQDLATIATRAFQEGYDFRFGLATAIPVVITDLSIRLIWAIRQYFQWKKPLKDCLPTRQHSDLRFMLILGNGVLCLMDGVDAGIRSGGNFLLFFMRMNMIAWLRFTTLVLKEVCIRAGIVDPLGEQLNAYVRVHEAVCAYLRELETMDVALFQHETVEYQQHLEMIAAPMSASEFTVFLSNTLENMGINKPWKGEFDTFMSDKESVLVFE